MLFSDRSVLIAGGSSRRTIRTWESMECFRRGNSFFPSVYFLAKVSLFLWRPCARDFERKLLRSLSWKVCSQQKLYSLLYTLRRCNYVGSQIIFPNTRSVSEDKKWNFDNVAKKLIYYAYWFKSISSLTRIVLLICFFFFFEKLLIEVLLLKHITILWFLFERN